MKGINYDRACKKLTGSSLWSEITQDDDGLFAFLDRSTFDGGDKLVLRVESPCLATEAEPLFTCDFGNSSAGCEVTPQNADTKFVSMRDLIK